MKCGFNYKIKFCPMDLYLKSTNIFIHICGADATRNEIEKVKLSVADPQFRLLHFLDSWPTDGSKVSLG
jgi:hypothetical protein